MLPIDPLGELRRSGAVSVGSEIFKDFRTLTIDQAHQLALQVLQEAEAVLREDRAADARLIFTDAELDA